jgi:hypothetical protein
MDPKDRGAESLQLACRTVHPNRRVADPFEVDAGRRSWCADDGLEPSAHALESGPSDPPRQHTSYAAKIRMER